MAPAQKALDACQGGKVAAHLCFVSHWSDKVSQQIGKLSDLTRLVTDGPLAGSMGIFTLAGVSSPVYLIYLFTSVTLLKNYYICICRISLTPPV